MRNKCICSAFYRKSFLIHVCLCAFLTYTSRMYLLFRKIDFSFHTFLKSRNLKKGNKRYQSVPPSPPNGQEKKQQRVKLCYEQAYQKGVISGFLQIQHTSFSGGLRPAFRISNQILNYIYFVFENQRFGSILVFDKKI